MNVESGYARTVDGMHVAYEMTGSGDFDIVFVRAWVGDIEHEWQEPVLARMLRRLGSVGRLIRLDRRGMGLSDRLIHRPPPTLEERLDDIRAVMDAVNSGRAVLVGLGDGSSLVALFAATYPERTRGVVLYEPIARWIAAADFPWAPTADEFPDFVARIRAGWGTRDLAARWVANGAPSRVKDERFIDWMAEQQGRAGSADDAVALAELQRDTDITAALPAIHVPTLVLTRGGGANPGGQYVAERIPGARLVQLEGADHFVIAGDTDAFVREVESFVEQLAQSPDETETDRVLATVLFTDIVGSTALAIEMRDRGWSELLERHHERAARIVSEHRGRVVDTAGDGIFASFDGPGRAIRCGTALVADARQLGLSVRAGLHTGECEMVGERLRGIAVHIGARVAALAAPSEVLVTRTVKDLVAGSGFDFADRGSHELKGVPGEWLLYGVV